MEIQIGCRFEVWTANPTHAIMLVEPHPDEHARVLRSGFELSAGSSTGSYLDGFGNLCRRITLPAGESTISFTAAVLDSGEIDETDPSAPELPPAELPDEVLQFLLPSRYCESDQLGTKAFQEFGRLPTGWQRVQAICQWVHDYLTFDYGTASPNFTAVDVLNRGHGVCRDFAQLAIALCRTLNIPARYVFGYLPDIGVPDPGTPMDFCAWMEVYLGDRWFTFDPRNHQHRIGRVVIGRGRDAADVAMLTSFGSVALNSMTVQAEPAQ